MKCRYCGADTRIVDTREKNGAVRRRRKCFNEVHSFYTWEVLPGTVQWKNVGTTGRDRNAESFRRRTYVAKHTNVSASELARRLGISEAAVRYIRNNQPKVNTQ